MSAENCPETMNADNGTRTRPPQRSLIFTLPDSRSLALGVLCGLAAITVGWLIVAATDPWTGDGWLNALAPILVSAAIAAIAIAIRRRRRAV